MEGSTRNMDGQVCIVTGASGGLGKATAQGLARLGATVVMACRDEARGEADRAEIASATGNGAVSLLPVDMASQQSVREAASRFKGEYGKLAVLVNNASIFKAKREVTPDGLEAMFATNHLGHFLLTNLLLEELKGSSRARVINIAAPSTTKVNFDDLQGERKFSALSAFGASKMCNLLFTYELARRLRGTGVTSNALHPGLMKSSLMREAPALLRWLISPISTTPTRASAGVLHLAASPSVEGVTGTFFKGIKPANSSAYSRDESIQRRLWDVSLELARLN